MSVSDECGNNFYKQNGSDNRYWQTGSESNSDSQNAGHIQNGSQTVQQTKRMRMIGCHDPITSENSIAMKHVMHMSLTDESSNVHVRRNNDGQSAL